MSGRPFTNVDDSTIRKYWGKIPAAEIGDKLNRPSTSIYQRGKAIGLPSLANRSLRQKQAEHWKRVGDLLHRAALKLPDPIVLRPPSGSLFGFPIRDLDPDTRALIDRALTERKCA